MSPQPAEEKSEKSVRDWLTALRKNETLDLESTAYRTGATPGSIASVFSQGLNAYFDKHKTDYYVMRRELLPSKIGMLALKPNTRMPTLRQSVKQRLKAYGIRVRYLKGLIEFHRAPPLKNPTF